VSGDVRTLPILKLTTSGCIECTDVNAIMLMSHPVVSWVEDKPFHWRNICLTYEFSLACYYLIITRFFSLLLVGADSLLQWKKAQPSYLSRTGLSKRFLRGTRFNFVETPGDRIRLLYILGE